MWIEILVSIIALIVSIVFYTISPFCNASSDVPPLFPSEGNWLSKTLFGNLSYIMEMQRHKAFHKLLAKFGQYGRSLKLKQNVVRFDIPILGRRGFICSDAALGISVK
jgi:hypothetical protein